MVDLQVSNDITLSPSDATPHLTINHDVAADLDSSNAFEGPEKLLEVWFASSATSLPLGTHENGLKAVQPSVWETMLDQVNCKVLSIVKSDHMDAYLLSESSMFVFPHKLILKTCGTTTLLLGLQRLLHIAAAEAGFPFHNASSVKDIRAAATPYRVFYSRKNFLFPDRQQGPHRSWKQEVKYLDDMFQGGSAYMVGKMNGDHWYLYMISPGSIMTPPHTPEEKTCGSLLAVKGAAQPADEVEDETLEILMTDLDVDLAKQFYLSDASAVASNEDAAAVTEARKEVISSLASLDGSPLDHCVSANDSRFDVFSNTVEASSPQDATAAETLTTEGHALGTVVSDRCGLSDVYPRSKYPDARIDAYLFSPCGFSANGVIPAPTDEKTGRSSASHYFTVHVTPEPNCSYASFETNVPGGQRGQETADVIEQVVNIFRPGRFSVTLFEAKRKPDAATGNVKKDGDTRLDFGAATKQRIERINGYRRIDRIVHDFEDYDLVFRYYEREGWVGDGHARVGEFM